jgi:hypothetical protein
LLLPLLFPEVFVCTAPSNQENLSSITNNSHSQESGYFLNSWIPRTCTLGTISHWTYHYLKSMCTFIFQLLIFLHSLLKCKLHMNRALSDLFFVVVSIAGTVLVHLGHIVNICWMNEIKIHIVPINLTIWYNSLMAKWEWVSVLLL